MIAFMLRLARSEPGQVRARSSSPSRTHAALLEKRRREGMRYVRIPLHVTKIDDLVRLGFLRGELRGSDHGHRLSASAHTIALAPLPRTTHQ
jgi:hypothetical protein